MSPTLFLSVFAIYIVGMIVLSVWISRRQTSGEDFLLGNRSVPLFLILGTTVATMVGTGSSMGAVGKGYADGWAGSLYGIGGALGILLLAKLFSKVRKYNFMTFSEEISFYYGANKTIKGIIGVLILIASIGWLGAHILGGGMYLAWIANIDLMYAKIIIALAFGVYVIIGGYMAVVWTDTIQALILFFGFILMAYMSVDKLGGFVELSQKMGDTQFAFLNSDQILPSISLAFVILVGVMATPSYRQRIYSADNISTVKKSFYLSGTLYLFFSFIPALIGISAQVLNPELENSNFAFPYLAVEVLPVSVGLIVLIAGLSATMSSASSDAIAGVSILLRDIYILVFNKMPDKEKMVSHSRWGLIGITGMALIFTMYSEDIISYIKNMISVVMSGMFVCSLLGCFWKRATWQGGIAALLGGATCSVSFMFNDAWMSYWGNPSIPSVLSACVVGVLVSLMTPENTLSDEESLAILEAERQLMEQHEEVHASDESEVS
ncbi:putative Na+/proline symporter [Lentisphaera araneosa HTCC2155]|uniref:Putative Na+/proline symporter n=1 Tax=Lentisphaera araneosa HTCC2155 TaxID=313628 RepID=A6DTP3_9BACT|nr:sodium:solute symporter family protein [Lentisphaera araneosa]EDM24970.1 putative Na+/proline symporter [Lentisphaera araneosa HTCC2155]